MAPLLWILTATSLIYITHSFSCTQFIDQYECEISSNGACQWSTSEQCKCSSSSKLDILFAIDASGTVTIAGFQAQKAFVESLVLQDINLNDTKIGFLIHATKVNFSREIQYWDPNGVNIRDYVRGLFHIGGWSNIGGATQQAIFEFQGVRNISSYVPVGERQKIFIFLADSSWRVASGDPKSICYFNTSLQSLGIRTVVITKDRVVPDSRCIAEESDYFSLGEDWTTNSFDAIINDIADVTCTKPPTLPPTTASAPPTNAPSASPSAVPSHTPSAPPTNAPTLSPSTAPSVAPSTSPTACVVYNYNISVIENSINSNDGQDNITDIDLSPQIQTDFALNAYANESVIYYNDPPTVDVPVPYINALIQCNSSDADVCYIECLGPASCLLANIVPFSEFTERILLRCDSKFSCKSMVLNYTQTLSPNVHEITIECEALLSCNEHVINILDTDNAIMRRNVSELSLTIYCVETFSCRGTTINIIGAEIEMHINIYCVAENSCKELSIVNGYNENINIDLWSFQYSEGIEIKTISTGYDLVDVHCGNEEDLRFLRYDTVDLLNEEEILMKARNKYNARRLPCEGITVTCFNIIDERVYDEQCVIKYKLSDLVDVREIIKSERNCFWMNINELYTPECDGNCGQNFTIYEYTMSVELELNLGINEEDLSELLEFFNNDTESSNVDEFVCNEYFGDINATEETLSSIDAIIGAALRFYKETESIHDITQYPDSHPLNRSSIDCDGFSMKKDVILINSTFSVQSITATREEVDILFATDSLFYDEVNNLFGTYYGESMVPLFVSNAYNSTLSPSIDPTPGPTQSPLECPYKTFQFGQISQCFVCDSAAFGYECKGGALLNIKYGHWVAAQNKESKLWTSNVSMINNDYDIVSLRCPAGQCCNDNKAGCDYLSSYISHTQCATHRNLSSVTCSRCNDAYDELIGSSACGKCKSTNYVVLSLLFIFASLFTLFLLFIMSKPNTLLSNINRKNSKEINWKKLWLYDQKQLLIVLISKICMYYYQGMNQILFTKNITPAHAFERTLLRLFDFDISILANSGNESGICVIAGLNSGIYKLLLSYTWYIFIAINIFIIALVSRLRTSWKPFIKITCINIILMASGPLLSTSFKLVTCIQFIDNKYYHFYDADIACFGSIWWFAGILPIFILCAIWMIFWFIIYKQDIYQREDENNSYRSLTKRFTSNIWYFEFILFLRRFGVAALSSFYGTVSDTMSNTILASFIIILLATHTKYYPFKHKKANMIESLCLFSTAAVVVALIAMDSNDISLYLSILIFTPLFIVCIIIIIILYQYIASKDSQLDERQIEKLRKRWVDVENINLVRVHSRVSMQEQINCTKSIEDLMPIIQQIGVEDLKKILSKYYDDLDEEYQRTEGVEVDAVTQTNLSDDGDKVSVNINTINIQMEDIYQDHSISSKLLTPQSPVAETAKETETETELVAIQISSKEQQALIKLYESNRYLWRQQITTRIRQHPQQFSIILKILENNNDEDSNENDASLTMKEFEKAFPSLNNQLIDCMFADIANVDDCKNVSLLKDKKLKITTILRWINSQKTVYFEEIEVKNDNQYIVIELYDKLDKYIKYSANKIGRGITIDGIKRNKYGRKLDEKYGFNKNITDNDVDDEWIIDCIEDEKINNKTQKDIHDILKQIDVNNGYQVTFKKRKKRKNTARKPAKCSCGQHHHGHKMNECKNTKKKNKTKTKQKKDKDTEI